MKKPELLAPAGSFEKAKTAFLYGADAVYCGTGSLSLRSRAEVDDDDLAKTIKYAHSIGKKVYAAINIYAWDEYYDEIKKQAQMLNDLKVDAIIASEAGKMISKETKIDILVTPLVTIGVGTGVAALIAPALGKAAMKIGELIMLATNLQPFLMGIAVSVLVGIALTLPISSAAICAAFGLTGLAGGAAVAGCCAQMVGFAVMSFKENRWGGLVSQGIGTSMLQMGNIIKNPRIWIAPIVTSAITGPMATCLFKLQMNGTPVSSGMGTCGFVGQIGVYSGWVADIANGTKTAITGFDWAGLILISFILPAVICPLVNMLLKKIGWVKDGDMKLS